MGVSIRVADILSIQEAHGLPVHSTSRINKLVKDLEDHSPHDQTYCGPFPVSIPKVIYMTMTMFPLHPHI